MEENADNNSAKVIPTQAPLHLKAIPAPKPNGELLHLRAAMRRFHVTNRTIYALVAAGEVHAVRPNGRTLYPAWELERAIIKWYYRRHQVPEAA